MQHNRPKLITWLSLLASITVIGWAAPTRSQVVPDATLGNGNNSNVNVNGIRTDINGGLRRGSSLFHSFDRFNIPTNFQVYFGNPAGIRNIFSRVTGRGISNIDGVLGVSGGANLYFMNPNGIIFGPNARLDISGSFFATTANAIAFPDNQKFASTGDRAVPLVEVNIPIGLQFGANPPAMLTNRGNLAVGAGQNLFLVGGNTTNTGSLTAPGGTVQVLGNQVALLEQSRIDVSSPTGGGTVLVGGDYQGRGAIVNAQSTIIGPDAVIKADALETGNGGRVIVWADGDTQFNGTISARGGAQRGNGGFVEVSGKQQLAFQGLVDTRAPFGQAGTLLLDPDTITIVTGGAGTIPSPIPATGALNLSPAAINAALTTGNLILQANDSITISSGINFTGNGNSLTFTASDIFLNASVTTNGAQSYNGAVTVGTPTATLTTNSNNVTFNNTVNSATGANNSLVIAAGTGTVNFNDQVGTGTNGALGNLTTTSNAIQLNATNTNNLNINASGNITQNGTVTVGGTTTLAVGGNDITLNDNNNFNTVQITSAGNVSLNDANALNLGTSNLTGTLNVTTNGAITQSGNLTIGGTTTLDANNSNINLNGGNNFNTVQINGGNNVFLNDVNTINLGSSTINSTLNVTASNINVLAGADITSTGGNIILNGTASLSSSGSLTASGRTVQLLGSTIALLGNSVIDVSGPTGGTALVGVVPGPGNTFTPTATSVTVLPTATINANSTISATGGTIAVLSTGNSFVFPNGITANGSGGNPTGTIQLPPNSTLDPNIFSNVDPTTSFFNDITIVNGNGQAIITDLVAQGLLPVFFVPFVQNDPIFAQLLTNTLSQNFQIPQTVLEGTTSSVLSGFVTGQTILLTARNNITVQDLTTQGLTANQLTFPATALPGSIQLAAGRAFSMNPGDTIQTNGRSLSITANGIPATNSLTIGSINTSSSTQVAGNVQLSAVTGNIAIGNGINPVSILSDSANNTTASNIQIQATGGTVNVNNALIQANSSTADSLAGRVSITSGNTVNLSQTTISTSNNLGRAGQVTINAPNTVNLDQTSISANGQFGSITIGSATSRPNTVVIQNNSSLTAQNDVLSAAPGVIPVAGSVNVQANTSITVNQSQLSSSATGIASAGAIALQTSSNTSGTISVLNSTLQSTASGSGGAGAIDVQNASIITLGGSTISNTVVDGTGGITRINGGTVQLNGGTTLQADTSGAGDAGDINITATAANPNPATSALSINNSQVRANTSNVGNAGTIFFRSTSGDIEIGNNSTVSTSSTTTGSPAGGAGTVDVQAATGKVTVDSSNIANTVVDGAGGNITVTARQVALQNNSQVNTSTSGTGNAGAIAINTTASDPNPTPAALTIDNSSITAISAPNARAAAGTFNQGDAGQVSLSAVNGSVAIANSSKISSSTTGNINAPGFGNGGVVAVTSQNLSLLSGSVIQARSDGTAAPGSIAVDIPNTIRIAGTNASGQVSEISTFSGANADLSDPTVGDIQINQPGTPVQNLELSDRGRINASTESTRPDFSGGSIQIYADKVRLTSGGQIVASSLNNTSPTSAQAGNIDLVVGNSLEISGSRPAFVDDPNFSAALSLTRFGNVDTSGTLLSNSGGLDIATLRTALGLSGVDPLLTNAADGSGIQLSAPGTTPRNVTFNWTFSTGESPGFFNDTSFYSVNNGALARLADANGNPAAPNPIAPSVTVGNGNVVNIGVVNVGDTAVASSLRLSNLTVDGQPAQILVSSPDINPTQPFISGIFARADGTGNAGTVTITGTQPTTRTTLSDGGQISTSTNSGGSTAPSNITLSGLNSLTTTSNSTISASTNSGVAGNVQINVTQGSIPSINLTGNSAIAATATNGGNAGSISITTPTFGMTDGATVGVSSANGSGIAGSVTLNANTVSLTNARISAETDAGGAVSPASITLEGLSTLQLNNAEISAITQTGRAGNVSVSANGAIALNNNSLLSVAGAGATGNSGNVTLTTPALTVNHSQISASTVGGTGGDVTLQGLNTLQADNGRITASTKRGQAGSLSVNASSAIDLNNSLISVEATELTGNSGEVTLTTSQLTLNNAQISASTVGGTGGDVTLQGLNTLQSNNSRVTASTQSGQAGNLSVSASDAIALNNNSLVSVEATEATGNSGKVTLTTPELTVNNSQISASTAGGVGGDVTLQGLNTLQVDSGRVTASTKRGQAGNLSVSASGAISLNNSLVSVEATEATGNSGKVTLTTPNLRVNNSQISASTVGGIGGGIALQGLDTLELDDGQVTASTKTGQAANLSVSVNGNINLANRSKLTVEADGANGIAGNVTVQGQTINLRGNSEVSSSARGDGAIAGNVTINGRRINVQSSLIKASSQEGPAGEIILTADRLDLSRGELLAEIGRNAVGRTGGIKLSVNNQLNMENESRISTLGRNGANGGDITILKVRFLFGKPTTGPHGNDIVGRADGGGKGGRVFLDRATLVQGFLFRRAVDGNRTNDIDTNGQLVNLSTNADVGARGLATPLVVFNDVSQIVTSACEAVGVKPTEGNAELKITGRGGVPISPSAPLPAQTPGSDWVTLELTPQVPVSITLPNGSTALLKPGEIYELQATCINGWKLRQRSLL